MIQLLHYYRKLKFNMGQFLSLLCHSLHLPTLLPFATSLSQISIVRYTTKLIIQMKLLATYRMELPFAHALENL
jgi:hypothetical protein